MLTSIILIVLIGLCTWISFEYDYLSSQLLQGLFVICLIIHLFALCLKGYDYGLFAAKKEAFENTLQSARKNGNEYETATISKEVALWNIELATRQHNNKTWFLNQYIDDRIEDLKPIE